MAETTRKVSLHGKEFNLAGGNIPSEGDRAPAFTVLDNDLKPVDDGILTGKTTVLLTVPSIDTPVCDTEVRKFNERATGLSDGVQILAVSTDLPFAQKRWCGSAGIDRVRTFSDHKDLSLGKAFGVVVDELRLLARTVFVIDRQGRIRYREIVPEISNEPDYDKAVEAVKNCLED